MIKDFVTVAGLRTYYWHAGSGPTLLMLHGQLPGSCVAVEWGDQVARFAAAGFSVYAPDIAGFGQTDNPPEHSIETRIAHARAFANHFEFTRYSIWGSSMGTYMGCAMALADPRVDKLIIMPSTLLPPPLPGAPMSSAPPPGSVGELVMSYTPSLDNARDVLNRVLINPAARNDARVKLFLENSNGKNIAAEQGRRAAGRPTPLHPELHRLKNRSLLLWGADDPNSVPERALLLQRAIPGAEFHVLPNCGHWPQQDQPDRTFDLVRAFLQT